jgi:hypothetical protein
MILEDLRSVLASCPPTTPPDGYRSRIIEDNVAAKGSLTSRERTFRYLRELYALDLANAEFRALRRLWDRDPASQPLMALVVAVQRDKAFRATVPAVVPTEIAEPVTSEDLAAAVETAYPGIYSVPVRGKIGRNALSSWKQAGYLTRSDRRTVVRGSVRPGPGAVAIALVGASAEGRAGERLFDADIVGVLGAPIALLHDRAHECARRGWLEYRSRGAVTEIDLSALTAPSDDPRLPLGGKGDAA